MSTNYVTFRRAGDNQEPLEITADLSYVRKLLGEGQIDGYLVAYEPAESIPKSMPKDAFAMHLLDLPWGDRIGTHACNLLDRRCGIGTVGEVYDMFAQLASKGEEFNIKGYGPVLDQKVHEVFRQVGVDLPGIKIAGY